MTKKSKNPPPLAPAATVSTAFGTILSHNFKLLAEWETAARSWEDTEGVHQMRVTFRRMRSALRVFRSAVPRGVSDPWSNEMRWFADQLGPARDLDVFIAEGLEAISGKLPLPGEDKLDLLAQQQRAAAYENVRAMLDSERYARFKQAFPEWLAGEGWLQGALTDKQRKRLTEDVIGFSRAILDKQERRVLAAGSHVDQDCAEAMHQLRIECKRLRYAAEFFSPLFDGMKIFIGHLKGLQDLLGVLNDVAVMHRLLDELLGDDNDPELRQYAGGLVGWRTRQYHEIKDTFGERWEEFAAAKQPWWRKAAA